MRNMAFSLTEQQARDRLKDITRRQAWWKLKVGTLVQQIVKGMGLKKGEKVERIHVIKILDVRAEPVEAITKSDVRREGFPDWSRRTFIDFYCHAHRIKPTDICNRIVFQYED